MREKNAARRPQKDFLKEKNKKKFVFPFIPPQKKCLITTTQHNNERAKPRGDCIWGPKKKKRKKFGPHHP